MSPRPKPLAERLAKFTGAPTATGCTLWSGPDRKGYPDLTLPGQVHLNVCRHVLEQKLGRKLLTHEQTRHTCDTPLCVNAAHLIPGTCLQNKRDAMDRGRHSRGERVNTAKLSAPEVLAIPARIASGESRRGVARELGLCKSTVARIASGKYWSHL